MMMKMMMIMMIMMTMTTTTLICLLKYYKPLNSSDLCIMGTPLFEKKINKKKELRARQDSKEIIRQLRDSGIVARPETRPGGISYEYFVKEKFALLKKPPVRLRKLKKAKKARDAKGDTKLREEMESHMQMAEKRRKVGQRLCERERERKTEIYNLDKLTEANPTKNYKSDRRARGLFRQRLFHNDFAHV